jgi:UDP-glucose 4-epimerase
MKILLTGSSGRVGRAIFRALATHHEVVGLDRTPFATTRLVGDFFDPRLLRPGLAGIDAIIHTASLHAPQVAVQDDREFVRVNVDGLARLLDMAGEAGIRSFVYTSTTALYGDAVTPGRCTWLDEHTPVLPRTIYHRTKAEAEVLLERAAGPTLAVRVLRMSRCFPEAVERMAVYRLHRGIDLRDVADAHAAALAVRGAAFQRYLVSGWTPFRREDTDLLVECPHDALALRCPALVSEFDRRGWPLPSSIDRVYDPSAAREALGWQSQYGFEEVLAQYDRRSLEVLPGTPWHQDRIAE